MASKRRFFRLHLSSVVLAVLAAGVVLGLNLRPRSVTTNGSLVLSDRAYVSAEFGWPETCFYSFPNMVEVTLWDQCEGRYRASRFMWEVDITRQVRAAQPSDLEIAWLWLQALKPILINAFTGIVVMVAVVVLNEWRIRRLSGRAIALPREKAV